MFFFSCGHVVGSYNVITTYKTKITKLMFKYNKPILLNLFFFLFEQSPKRVPLAHYIVLGPISFVQLMHIANSPSTVN